MRAALRGVWAGILVLGLGTLWCALGPAATAVQAEPTPQPPFPHPINVPTGPQTSASACPNPPELSSPLPPGATISAPSLAPAGSVSISANGTTDDVTGTCEYTMTVPTSLLLGSSSSGVSPDSISITYVGFGHDFYYPAGVADSISFTYGSRSCNTTAEIVSAYGLAVAEQQLNAGNCTSNADDSSPTWGYADAINTLEQVAPLTQEPTFHTMYQSYESGNIFFGQFQECMENPVGQQSSYVCTYNNYSPLF